MLFIVIAASIGIWILMEVKRLKHKLFAIFLVMLLILGFVSTTYIFKNQDIDYATLPGIVTATKIYFSWLVSIFNNTKTITANAIKMDWSADNSTDF